MTQKHRTKFSERVSEEMAAQGVTVRDLAEKCESTYEHVRKLVAGDALPSKYMVQAISEALKMNRLELDNIAIEDRARAKGWTKIVAAAAGKNPELEPIEGVWLDLSEQHRQDIVAIAETLAKADRAARSKAKHLKIG